MKRTARWLALIPFISFAGCALFFPHGSEPHHSTSVDLLKKACLEAAVKAIETEINRHQEWIGQRKQNQVDPQDLPELENRMSVLKEDLNNYRSMAPKGFQLSEPIKLKAWVEGRPEPNAIIHVQGMSRLGPWYHLAGIKGDDYGVLKSGVKYLMSFYKVYPRSYFNMESSYVYLAEFQEDK